MSFVLSKSSSLLDDDLLQQSDNSNYEVFTLPTARNLNDQFPLNVNYNSNFNLDEVLFTATMTFGLPPSPEMVAMLLNPDGSTQFYEKAIKLKYIKTIHQKKVVLFPKQVKSNIIFNGISISMDLDVTAPIQNILKDLCFPAFSVPYMEGYTLFVKQNDSFMRPLDYKKRLIEDTLSFDTFYFKRCYFVISRQALSDDAIIEQVFKDCRDEIMTNKFLPISRENVITFTYYRLIAERKLSIEDIKAGNFDFESMIPPSLPKKDGQNLLKYFITYVSKLNPPSWNDAAIKYIKNARVLTGFGSIRFEGSITNSEFGSFKNVIIEIGPLLIRLFDMSNQIIISPITYPTINSIYSKNDVLKLKYLQRNTHKFAEIEFTAPHLGMTLSSLIVNYINITKGAMDKQRQSSSVTEDPCLRVVEDYTVEYRRALSSLTDAYESFTDTSKDVSVFNKVISYACKRTSIINSIRHLEDLIREFQRIHSSNPDQFKYELPQDKPISKIKNLFESCNQEAQKVHENLRFKEEQSSNLKSYYQMITERVVNGVNALSGHWKASKDKGNVEDQFNTVNKAHDELKFYENEIAYIKNVYSRFGFFEKMKISPKPDDIEKKVSNILSEVIDLKTTLIARFGPN